MCVLVSIKKMNITITLLYMLFLIEWYTPFPPTSFTNLSERQMTILPSIMSAATLAQGDPWGDLGMSDGGRG